MVTTEGERATRVLPVDLFQRVWPLKSAGLVLGVHPKKTGQAIDPAFRKVATLMLADPALTLAELHRWTVIVRTEAAARGVELPGR